MGIFQEHDRAMRESGLTNCRTCRGNGEIFTGPPLGESWQQCHRCGGTGIVSRETKALS